MKTIEMSGQVRWSLKVGNYVIHNNHLYTLMGFDNGKYELDSEFLFENKLVLPRSITPFFLQLGDVLMFYAMDSRGDIITDSVSWVVLNVVQRKSGIFVVLESKKDNVMHEITLKEIQLSMFSFVE